MESIKDSVIQILKDHLGNGEYCQVNPIRPEHRLKEDLGADSLDAIELVMAAEERFDIEIPDAATDNIKTVQDLIAVVETKTAA